MSIAAEKTEIIIHEEWLRSLETRVAETKWEGWRTDGPTIFKVPRIFQVAESEAYVPKMVSLGPYHHGNIDLKAMEGLKWHYLKKFLGRNPDKTLKDYIKQIKEKEPQARMAYSEKVDKTSDEFAQMMLLDCCFVIEILHLWKPCVERREKEEEASYVVYFGGHSHRSEEALLLAHDRVVNSHYEFLGSFLGSKQKAQDAIFYSYTKYINGFAADLEEEEAMEISSEAFSRNFHHAHAFPPFTVARLLFAEHAGVISVFPSRGHTLHTTRSWDFLCLQRNGRVPPSSIYGSLD
ncbi:UPF0481 protein [Musa troglodytarum]|uniref:UPF0481 protein n=1 Tax=Musa troglodytarum TaxID=320322 RepID=A0A9E7FPD9_9LILI|nr:UPF0481 protein [Musa troglodytarum]